MEYKKVNCNSYNIHTIKTDKFKTVRMEIIFSREVKKEEMPIFTFLGDILSDCSKEYPSRKDIAIRLEELYQANFYSTTNKVGNLFTITFVLEFINPQYIEEEDYLKNVLTFVFNIINHPRVKNHEFALTNFNIIKKRMLEEIESIKESSSKLAIMNALKQMDKDSPSSYKVLGTKEDIDKITPSNLYDAYLSLFNHSICDIFLIGNIVMEEAIKVIKKNFKNHVIKSSIPKLIVNNKEHKKVLKVKEESNFIQSTLVMIYNIKSLDKNMKDIAFHVFNYIFGSGGISSKLYKNLRTDNSLCYSVRSMYLKYDELLLVEVSLDYQNLNLASKLIKKCINEMVSGNYSDDTLEDAKRNLCYALKMGSDNNVSVLNNYVFNYLDNLPLLEKRIELIKSVSKKDLITCAKSLVLNTIYMQVPSNGGSHERD